jgi:hypothetical protein
MPRLTLLIWFIVVALLLIGNANTSVTIPAQSCVAFSNGDIAGCPVNTGCGTSLSLVVDTRVRDEKSAVRTGHIMMTDLNARHQKRIASAGPANHQSNVRPA